MKKWFVGAVCLILIIAILIFVVLFNLGPVVKTAVNHYGPDVTKTEMRLGRADVSVFKGCIQLENFVLGNPKGFSTPSAIDVESVHVDVDESSLIKDTIIINRIEVLHPKITYEIKGVTDNFRTMMDNMKKSEKPHTAGEKEKSGKQEGKKIVIRDLILKNIQVNTAAAVVGGDIVSTTIPEIHLRNVGEKQKGVDTAEALLIVLNKLYEHIISPDVLGVLQKEMKGLGQELEGVTKEIKSLANPLKGLFK